MGTRAESEINTSMKLLHYQVNNFHIKLTFNPSGLLLFSGSLYNHTRHLYRSVNNREVLLGVHTLWTDEQELDV